MAKDFPQIEENVQPSISQPAAINRRGLTVYLLIAFAIAWVLFLLPLLFSNAQPMTRQLITLFCWSVAMFAPAIAAIVANRSVDQQPLEALGITRLNISWLYLAAWLVPIVLVAAAIWLSALLGAGRFDPTFSTIRNQLASTPGGDQASLSMVIALQISFALTLAPLINTLFALGEELGWRGYLLPNLLPLGTWKAVIISGLIWGVWHWPAILQGHNYPGHPFLGMFLMVGFTVLFGAFLSWLYLRTRSPWAPALAHGTLNAVAGLPLLFLLDVDLAFGGTITSLVGWIPLLALVGWLAWRGEFRDVSRETIN